MNFKISILGWLFAFFLYIFFSNSIRINVITAYILEREMSVLFLLHCYISPDEN